MQLILGDCLEQLALMPDACVDAVVTDPPYGLSFMGKRWDYDVPSVEIWQECLRVLKPGGHLLAFAGTRTQHRMAVRIEDAGFEIRDMIAWCYGSGFPKSRNLDGDWEGWGTALKPALEPITVARKPLIGTVAANVLEHGTGALNIDGCRVGNDGGTSKAGYDIGAPTKHAYGDGLNTSRFGMPVDGLGRWPANLIHDGSEEPSNLLGDAARFFYTAKASSAERQGTTHPTVKPLDLMAYLCRLVTPPGGVVLDPFMGSGTTIKAAIGEGFDAIGIERDPDYFAMAEHRMNEAQIGLPLAV